MRKQKSQRGAASLEVVIIVPLVVLLSAVVIAGWRLGWARANMRAAVSAGARAATLQKSGSLARQHAGQVVSSDLNSMGVICKNLSVQVDTSQFARPVGSQAEVTVSAACTLDLSDLLISGMPGSVRLSARSVERLDTFRERRP